MLIDKIRAFVPYDVFHPDDWNRMLGITDRISRYCPRTGAITWDSAVWSSERSDTHHISFRVAGDGLWVSGSPAKVLGDGDAVFGTGPAKALDLCGSLEAMYRFLAPVFQLEVTPPFVPSQWRVTAVDVTDNLVLANQDEVDEVLALLRGVEGGRYKVSAQAGQTVYWSHRSKLRSGKAYAKGRHLISMQKRKDYTGRCYSPTELKAAERLLRLELSLKGEWFRRNRHWWKITAKQLEQLWYEYFGRMSGEQKVRTEKELHDRVMAMAETEGRGRAALGCWAMIQSLGWEKARNSFAKSSWYRHLTLLRDAGLDDGDISHGKVIPVTFRVHEARRVESWAELQAA